MYLRPVLSPFVVVEAAVPAIVEEVLLAPVIEVSLACMIYVIDDLSCGLRFTFMLLSFFMLGFMSVGFDTVWNDT